MTRQTLQRLQALRQRGEITEAEFAQYANDGGTTYERLSETELREMIAAGRIKDKPEGSPAGVGAAVVSTWLILFGAFRLLTLQNVIIERQQPIGIITWMMFEAEYHVRQAALSNHRFFQGILPMILGIAALICAVAGCVLYRHIPQRKMLARGLVIAAWYICGSTMIGMLL